jgi:hypothetical protein
VVQERSRFVHRTGWPFPGEVLDRGFEPNLSYESFQLRPNALPGEFVRVMYKQYELTGCIEFRGTIR